MNTSEKNTMEVDEKPSFKDIKNVLKQQVAGCLKSYFYAGFNDYVSRKIVDDVSKMINPLSLVGLVYDYKVLPPEFNEKNGGIKLSFALKEMEGIDFTVIEVECCPSGEANGDEVLNA